ncbi:hypothetical protein PVK06_006130 [Gossypium arboreum]|uniref:Uncharacterized protein n=1 Tax=Gossypium arboreum TaxID=29729 RepID=A0ABR0QWG1_GOSAR|nr:hypothetical protein PVK06_006130 [Gossypium arboreum]
MYDGENLQNCLKSFTICHCPQCASQVLLEGTRALSHTGPVLSVELTMDTTMDEKCNDQTTYSELVFI